ncbi:MAG: hypothetical protein QNK31_13165, partial [Porticoccus sp.]|nr:hypothetical protein [Porticoccus sp.]
GGHKELITHGQNGCLFQADNANDLARVVTELLGAKNSWPEMKINGRQFVEQDRNWANSVGRYQKVYGDIQA